MAYGGNWEGGRVVVRSETVDSEPARTQNASPAEPVVAPAGGGGRRISRRDALRLGLFGLGGVLIGGLGGFALGRSTAPSATAPHPVSGAPERAGLASASFPITIGADARSLVDSEGRHFLYLADTPWNAISRMTRESFTTLATARSEGGFTALQMSVLDFDPRAENAYGERPFAERGDLAEPLRGEADYWTHVEWCVDECARLGLVACLVPSWYGGWGDAWRGYVTEDNAAAYGTFLADLLGDRPNVWWLLGGDNDPTDEGEATSGVPGTLSRGPVVAATIQMGRALFEGQSVPQLMSYHTAREMTVEEHFGDEAWYQLSAAYSGADSAPFVRAEFDRSTVRPVILWESYYDGRDREPLLDRREVRAQAYHAFLSGAAGAAYGHEDVWPVTEEWPAALAAGSAEDVRVLSTLLAAFVPGVLEPLGVESGLLPDGHGTPGTASAVAVAALPDGAGAMAYFGEPRSTIRIDTTALDADATFAIRWFDPATGEEFFVADDRAGEDVVVSWPSTWSDAVLLVRR